MSAYVEDFNVGLYVEDLNVGVESSMSFVEPSNCNVGVELICGVELIYAVVKR